MILIDTQAFGSLRQELIEGLGVDSARGLLTRMGYVSGSRDAALARKVRGRDNAFDAFAVGPQLHSLEGIVLVEPVRIDIDSATGRYYGEFLWKDSSEDEAHLAVYGVSSSPACWMQTGYACGYTSAFMGRRILYREVECRAMGNALCRVIGKPAEEWDEPEADLKYLLPQSIAKQPVRTFGGGPAEGDANTGDHGGGAARARSGLPGKDGLIGASAGFTAVLHKISKVAPTGATVLLMGESGVGKSMVARYLHAHSARADRVFVEVNCGAVPEQLMESELFGTERGAYTGAVEARPGRFEAAKGGTLFLDEIGTLSLTAQTKLLRVLQNGELERLGSTKTIHVDVRVIAATNDNLKQAVKDGRFRGDLFYRLNVFPILIPPLRERKDDIPILIEFFLDKFSRRHARSLKGLSSRALHLLLDYPWPGNIREMENVIERGVILAEESGTLDVGHLFASDDTVETKGAFGLSDLGSLVSDPISTLGRGPPAGQAADRAAALDEWAEAAVQSRATSLSDVQDALVRAALKAAQGNVSEAARALGLTRAQLDYRLKKHGSA